MWRSSGSFPRDMALLRAYGMRLRAFRTNGADRLRPRRYVRLPEGLNRQVPSDRRRTREYPLFVRECGDPVPRSAGRSFQPGSACVPGATVGRLASGSWRQDRPRARRWSGSRTICLAATRQTLSRRSCSCGLPTRLASARSPRRIATRSARSSGTQPTPRRSGMCAPSCWRRACSWRIGGSNSRSRHMGRARVDPTSRSPIEARRRSTSRSRGSTVSPTRRGSASHSWPSCVSCRRAARTCSSSPSTGRLPRRSTWPRRPGSSGPAPTQRTRRSSLAAGSRGRAGSTSSTCDSPRSSCGVKARRAPCGRRCGATDPLASRCLTRPPGPVSRASAEAREAAVLTKSGKQGIGGDGGESNSPSRTLNRKPLRACPMVCRRPPGRASALCRTVQSRVPRSGLSPDYATLIRFASPLNDASTTREDEVASTLTLAAYAARARAGWRLPVTSFCCLINEAWAASSARALR